MVESSARAPHEIRRRSWWSYLLPVVWVGLAAHVVVALARGVSLREDYLSLALIAFFMTTFVLGSRVWLWVHDHLERTPTEPRPELRRRHAGG